jgi:uncharacterized membrane protein
MNKARLEAFSDGVIAIIITIMVLELKVPHGEEWADLGRLWPVFLSYVLSFVHVGIYWNNHHHLLHTVKTVNGSLLWANLHLLFWLSLIPFATGWMGENHFAILPVAIYGFILLCCGVAYWLMTLVIIAQQGNGSLLAKAVGKDIKGKLSVVLYAFGMGLSFVSPWLAIAVYATVAAMWLIPDRRISSVLGDAHADH